MKRKLPPPLRADCVQSDIRAFGITGEWKTMALKADVREGFNDWGGRGYDGFVPGEVTKTTPSGDETT